MSPRIIQLPPGPGFWPAFARRIAAQAEARPDGRPPDLSGVLVMVPAYAHSAHLRDALAQLLGPSFIPPQIRTPAAWLAQQAPDTATDGPAAASERLMALYATLRELGWLKKLFAARRNTDLLPLAQTLVALCDELTAALLPDALAQPDHIEDRWQAALARLSPRAAALLSDEARLVWNLWHAERDARDPGLLRHAAWQRAAQSAAAPLFWCAPGEPDAIERAFLAAYAQRQPVEVVGLDWGSPALPALLLSAWPELSAGSASTTENVAHADVSPLPGLSLLEARGLEDEATLAAHTILGWLASGRQRIALVPQDRVVARRVRALLERAQVVVSDETGWKLSTTRAAAVLHAWLTLAASGGERTALLDFLQSPYLSLVDGAGESAEALQRALEAALLAAGTARGWPGVMAACANLPGVRPVVEAVAREAERTTGRKRVSEWVSATREAFEALGMLAPMQEDGAGAQVLEMLARLEVECTQLDQRFSLAEWRSLIDLQMEQTVFVAARDDRRVMMVPLNGTTLRHFDAAIVVGADAEHLPSRAPETLFFAHAVRHELGLSTREALQRQQLCDFAGLLLNAPQVVLSWQGWRDGEAVAPASWIQRLELTLALHAQPRLTRHRPSLATVTLQARPASRPQPSAPALRPAALSAGAYNALVACPYQFFAMRMLGLSAADALNELPQKRDYGDWLHDILMRYHEALRAEPLPPAERFGLMERVSDAVFGEILDAQPAALGYYARWRRRWPAYVEWANEHEASGWTFAAGEQPAERVLALPAGAVRLHGRIDRIDRNAQGDLMVLDYKSKQKNGLQARLKGRDDHQLAFYGLLLGETPSAAAYVPLDDETCDLASAKDYDLWCDALLAQITDNLQAIADGAPLTAAGAPSTCAWCTVRGLCRKGAWE